MTEQELDLFMRNVLLDAIALDDFLLYGYLTEMSK